jgi:molybdopterin-guanine dinucleotide biosynthesis protein A
MCAGVVLAGGRSSRVRVFGSGPHVVRAATVGGAADALDIVFDRHVTAALNGDRTTRDRAVPLAASDTVLFLPAAAGR